VYIDARKSADLDFALSEMIEKGIQAAHTTPRLNNSVLLTQGAERE
jgi:hypothetical protein